MRNFFRNESDAEVVRAAEPLGFTQGMWQKVSAVGLPGMCLPDEVGGGGSDLLGADFAAATDEWKVLTAAALVGVAAKAQELGVQYAIARHQFDRPIGSFQAVQHGLADMVGPIHGARLLTAKAAWACDHDPGDRA